MYRQSTAALASCHIWRRWNYLVLPNLVLRQQVSGIVAVANLLKVFRCILACDRRSRTSVKLAYSITLHAKASNAFGLLKTRNAV